MQRRAWNRLPRSPRFNASIGVQYTFEVPSLGAMTPRVDFYYRGALAFRQFGDSLDEQEAYTRTDARITWRPPGENLWIELFMRNLENNHVKTNQDIFENVYRLHYYAAPRSGGLSVGFDYGKFAPLPSKGPGFRPGVREEISIQ